MSLRRATIVAMPEFETHYAHSPDSYGRWHPLAEHLRSVAQCAATMAGAWPWAEEARLAGLLHDLGKYGDLFQRRASTIGASAHSKRCCRTGPSAQRWPLKGTTSACNRHWISRGDST